MVDRSRSSGVIEELSKLISVHGATKVLRSDHGLGFVSRAILKWSAKEKIDTAFIEPRKPSQKRIQ
jgi:putative transposase